MAIEQFIPEEETMNEKHTPGPWKYSHRGVYFYSNVHKYGETIAKCYGNNYQANARLIAAAPALLEACRGLLMRIAIAAIDNDPIMPQEPEIIAAQAAIKLAEKEGAE